MALSRQTLAMELSSYQPVFIDVLTKVLICAFALVVILSRPLWFCASVIYKYLNELMGEVGVIVRTHFPWNAMPLGLEGAIWGEGGIVK